MFYFGNAILAIIASLSLAAGADDAADAPATPLDEALLNRELVDEYRNSFAVVRYYMKKNEKGEEPGFEIPYVCPNCNSTHYRDGGESAEKGIPAEFAGFVIAPDRVLMQDIMVKPEFVDRIEIECAGEVLKAEEFETAPARHALVLKTARPFASAKPLKFAEDGKAPCEPLYFFIVREDGETVAGFDQSHIESFRHHVELGLDLYKGNPNTLVLRDDGEAFTPVTVAFEQTVELGAETFVPPAQWRTEPALKRFERLADAEARLRKAVLPVYLQLEAKSKEGGRFSFRIDSGSEQKNDIDTIGVLVEGGLVIIPAKLAPADTARLVKIEAALPDGSKARLDFAGSYVEEGALAARFAGKAPEGLEPFALDRREAIDLWGDDFFSAAVFNRGGSIDVEMNLCRVDGFKRERGNRTVAGFQPVSSATRRSRDEGASRMLFSRDGKLTVLSMPDRRGRWSSDAIEAQGSALASLADKPAFDAENVPRKADDRRRTPWLGVEVQPANADVLREKKAVSYLGEYVERAPLVTEVAEGTPAAALGIKPGDVLLSVRYPGSSRGEMFSLDREVFSEINWDEAFADDRFIEFGSSGEVTPWPNVEGGVNEVLAKFGVGTEVVVAWVSDGTRREGKTTLALAPVHYRNAPRARNKELGMTVCDMTHEVRKYFKLSDDAPGVVVAKVKSGGVAAVAGVRPLELIIDVNGEGVKSAKDFAEKTKGAKELDFTVRRLSATRVVPVRL